MAEPTEPQVQELVALSALISRMRVLSSSRTVASAEKILEATISAYFAPNKTIRELHEVMKSRAGIDPLKDFSEVAREELRAFAPAIRRRSPALSAALPLSPWTASLLAAAKKLAP